MENPLWRPLMGKSRKKKKKVCIARYCINVSFNELTPVMNSLDMPNHNVILAGDFNIKLLKVNENIVHGEFIDLLMSLSLNPQNT